MIAFREEPAMTYKYLQVAAELQRQITRGTHSDKLPTEAALSEQFQVSRQTIRQSLDCLVQRGLIAKKQGSGSKILLHRADKGSNIAVILPVINDYIYPTVLQDIQVAIGGRNYSTLLFSHNDRVSSERSILQNLLKQPVAGIIAVGTKSAFPSPNLDLYEKLALADIPVVFLYAGYRELSNAVSVTQDNFGGAYMLTRHLISRGHTKIAGMFMSDLTQGIDRYSGYMTAMRDAGLTLPDAATLWYTSEEARFLSDYGHTDMIEHFIDYYLRDRTAVICYNDVIADQLIRILLKRGLQVPQNVAVVSFDNSYFCDLCPVHITSLEPDTKQVGRIVANLLLDKMGGTQCNSITLPWKLIQRQSG